MVQGGIAVHFVEIEIILLFQDGTTLITALCLAIKPIDESLATKTSHLINNIITKQNLTFSADYYKRVISWHIDCLRQCTDILLPDILHNLQCILQYQPQVSHMVSLLR